MDENEQQILNFIKANTVSTGSRYWASVDPELIVIEDASDYDFVVSEHSPVIAVAVAMAEKLNVNIKQFSDYDLDPSTYSVICFGTHTQLIIKYEEWYNAYIIAQSLCTPTFYHNFLWKKNGIAVPLVRERWITMMSFFIKDLKINKNMMMEDDNQLELMLQ